MYCKIKMIVSWKSLFCKVDECSEIDTNLQWEGNDAGLPNSRLMIKLTRLMERVM